MIQIVLAGYPHEGSESLAQDLRVLAGLFFPGDEVSLYFTDHVTQSNTNDTSDVLEQVSVKIAITVIDNQVIASYLSIDGILPVDDDTVLIDIHSEADFFGKKQIKNIVKLALYDLLSKRHTPHTGWGILIGIRPVKIVHDLLDLGVVDLSEIQKYLYQNYRVSDSKAALVIEVAERERSILSTDRDKVSVYICIPFCTSRCLYCSFPSNSVAQKGHLMGDYLSALIKEIVVTSNFLKSRGLLVDCIYIGGGTPTSLSEEAFEALLNAVDLHLVKELAANGLKEYSIEAGRPDTITEKKLRDMKRFGVNRLCINPQTMTDSTLVRIGRDHGTKAIIKTFELAREIGFEVINADLIIGLPGEGTEDVNNTVEAVMALRPENITVHTLAVKRASRLNEERKVYTLGEEESKIDLMYDLAIAKLRASGYRPYYLYRQKNMLGNLENVGMTLESNVCLYNVRMMGDRHSIIALGAGSVSKLVWPENGRIERLANAKGIEDYISRIDMRMDAKNQWLTQLY